MSRRTAVLILVVLALSLPIFAKDHFWRTGRLLSFTNEDWTSSATSPVNCSTIGGVTNCSGGQTANWNHVTYYVTIMEGSKSYYATKTLSFRWQHSPRLTENSRVKFAIDGDMLILVDDDGHEFKMHVGKRRNNTITERVEECRSTVQEIHQAYPDLPQLNTWLASLAGPELLNIHSHNLGCSADCMQVRDMALLSQLEVIRAEMLVARTAKDRPGQQQVSQEVAVDGCKALVSAVEGGPIKDMAQGQLADSARRLYDCAMDEYKHDENKWFLPTARAREKLLVEVLARQTGAPIGEHQQAQPSEAGK